MLTAALQSGTESLKKFAEQMAAISGAAVTIQIQAAADAGDDRAAAEAIKRGQKPESIAAMRKALGL